MGKNSGFSIEMMNRDRYVPTLNLDKVDLRCGELDYLVRMSSG